MRGQTHNCTYRLPQNYFHYYYEPRISEYRYEEIAIVLIGRDFKVARKVPTFAMNTYRRMRKVYIGQGRRELIAIVMGHSAHCVYCSE